MTFENQKDAEECVAMFDKKELDGRTINVEKATTKETSNETQTEKPATRGRTRPARGGKRPTSTRAPKSDQVKEGEPSKTTLFVANLPFKFRDEDLLQLFGTYAPVKAHIIIRRNGMSKGYGFVEFANENDQQKALALNNVECEGRSLIVKVALGSETLKENENSD